MPVYDTVCVWFYQYWLRRRRRRDVSNLSTDFLRFYCRCQLPLLRLHSFASLVLAKWTLLERYIITKCGNVRIAGTTNGMHSLVLCDCVSSDLLVGCMRESLLSLLLSTPSSSVGVCWFHFESCPVSRNQIPTVWMFTFSFRFALN